MHDLILSYTEAKIMKKSKNFLERTYHVKIYMPDISSSHEAFSNDCFVASVEGINVNAVKNYLKRRLKRKEETRENNIFVNNNVPTITLSDSESSNSDNDIAQEHENGDSPSSTISANCMITKNEVGETSQDIAEPVSKKPRLEASTNTEFIPLDCEAKKDTKDDSIIVLEPDLVVVNDGPCRRKVRRKRKASNNEKLDNDDSVILLDPEPKISVPVVKDPKFLRPVVIDGSNVARAHGQFGKTFSAEGIKIAIDYFINRGHTQVTAFVPHYRRHCKNGLVKTTGETILEELAEKQLVVFTPSRKVNGKSYSCYDDRFIVELAARTGGVILSNDNFRDIMDESPEFKKTVEERLLMFCFAGDNFMVPQDPLGRDGPCLDEFLSFPQT